MYQTLPEIRKAQLALLSVYRWERRQHIGCIEQHFVPELRSCLDELYGLNGRARPSHLMHASVWALYRNYDIQMPTDAIATYLNLPRDDVRYYITSAQTAINAGPCLDLYRSMERCFLHFGDTSARLLLHNY